jgi:hypothetical protein
MKLILTVGLLLAASFAQADSFTIIRDGKNYLCEEENPVIDPGGQVKCIDKAYSGPFSRSESERICAGAHDEGPALCAIKAYGGPFSKEESIGLCVGARNVGPAEYAVKAYSGPFSKTESLNLCERGTLANAECAIKAYAGPYSKEEALRLCKSNPALVLRSLNLLEQSSDIQEKIRSMKK